MLGIIDTPFPFVKNMKLSEMFDADVDSFTDGECIAPDSTLGKYLVDNRPHTIEAMRMLSSISTPIEMYLIGMSIGFHLVKKYGIPDDIDEILDYS
jgi:hypothetical protein